MYDDADELTEDHLPYLRVAAPWQIEASLEGGVGFGLLAEDPWRKQAERIVALAGPDLDRVRVTVDPDASCLRVLDGDTSHQVSVEPDTDWFPFDGLFDVLDGILERRGSARRYAVGPRERTTTVDVLCLRSDQVARLSEARRIRPGRVAAVPAEVPLVRIDGREVRAEPWSPSPEPTLVMLQEPVRAGPFELPVGSVVEVRRGRFQSAQVPVASTLPGGLSLGPWAWIVAPSDDPTGSWSATGVLAGPAWLEGVELLPGDRVEVIDGSIVWARLGSAREGVGGAAGATTPPGEAGSSFGAPAAEPSPANGMGFGAAAGATTPPGASGPSVGAPAAEPSPARGKGPLGPLPRGLVLVAGHPPAPWPAPAPGKLRAVSDEDDDGSEVGSESAHPLQARLASIVPPHRVVGLREATLSIVAALAGPLLEDVEVTRGRLALGDEEVELDHRNGGEIEGARVLARWLARRSPAWRLIGLRYGDEEEDCAFACSSRAEAEAVRVLPVRWLWEPEPFLADPPPEVLRLGERELPVHFPILPDPSGGARARLRADHPTGDILLPRGAVVVARDEARGFCDVGATPARYGAFLLGSGARITLRVGGGAEAFGPLAAPIDVGLALGVGDVVELCDGRLVGVLLAAERSGSAGTFPAGAALVVDGDRFLP